jgi:hypothetical protein
MRSDGLSLRDCEGKGVLGCAVFLVLLGVAIVLAIKLGPIYYANFNFESEIETEASRAGARFMDDETIIRDLMAMAKRNDIRLKKEDIKVERYAGQVHIEVQYAVPVDYVFFQRDVKFHIKASSFVGSL